MKANTICCYYLYKHYKNKVIILAKYLVNTQCSAGKGFMQWELILE